MGALQPPSLEVTVSLISGSKEVRRGSCAPCLQATLMALLACLDVEISGEEQEGRWESERQ